MKRSILLFLCAYALAAVSNEREYWIAIASYRHADQADGFVDRASELLNRRVTVRSAVTDDGIVYRVTSGPHIGRDAADAALLSVRNSGFADAWLFSELVADWPTLEASSASDPSASSENSPARPEAPRETRSLPATPPTAVPPGYGLHRLRRDDSP
jgi:hypothetical protein